VDVPGDSLRVVVMEGVPWPRPTVLHAARRAAGGGSAYDDRVVRARLAQAFGRLIRRREDEGMFVLLSAATPSRLLSAFPPGVSIRRVPLAEAIERVRSRLSTGGGLLHQPAHEDADAFEARKIDLG
jgi:ATP-dependent DNA helicase DinG